jgi:hypothetical protein
MMENPPALASTDEPQTWRSLQTQASAGLAREIFCMLVILFCGGLMAFSGRGARDPWLSSLFIGGGTFMMIGTIWWTLWTSWHGSFNLDINPKTKRIRKWKTSFFLKRSFDEYAYDDFRAVRSVQKFENDGYCVMVELLFKATKPALEVARFNAIGRVASYRQRGASTRCLVSTENPKGAVLRHELAGLMDITDAGYFDNEQ